MMKMRNPRYIPVSDRVGRILDRYVEVERQEMLGSTCATAAAWVTFGGDPGAPAISSIVATSLVRRFGTRRGPLFFRHCLATTSADRLPTHPLDGATVLAHAPATTIKSYSHTSRVSCARRLETLLETLRPGLKPTRPEPS